MPLVQKDKSYTKMASKEEEDRIYYGVASCAIPFHWEIRPGTPKHPKQVERLPPLTPPPSHLSSPIIKTPKLLKRPSLLHRWTSRRSFSSSPSNCSRSSSEEELEEKSGLCYSYSALKALFMSMRGLHEHA